MSDYAKYISMQKALEKKVFFKKNEKCRSFLVFLTIQPLHCQAA